MDLEVSTDNNKKSRSSERLIVIDFKVYNRVIMDVPHSQI